MVGDGKFIEVVVVLGIQPKCHKGQALTPFLAHDQETEVFKGRSKVVRCTSKVEHDGAIAVLAKTDHLVILADNLRSAFREVEGEGCLLGAKVVDVEDQFFGKVFRRAPDHPANTRVDLEDH